MPAKTSEFKAKHSEIVQDIKSENFKHCYLVYGEEAYLRNQVRDELKKALLGSGDSMNMTKYDGKDINVAEVIDMAETMPFFAERRVIVIEESGLCKSGCPELAEYLKAPSETAYFLIVESSVDKRKDMYKAANASGITIECDTPDIGDLRMWAARRLKLNGFNVAESTLNFFFERVGTDMSNASNELEKIICYCDGRDTVTVADVDAVCANWLSNQIFAMTDAIVEHNQKKAMDLYYDLLALREPPQKILALIFRQFNIMLQVKEMADNHKDKGAIASAVHLAPFIVGKYINWARSYTTDQLKKCLELCVDNDEAYKSGKLDDVISVEMIIVKCSSKPKSA